MSVIACVFILAVNSLSAGYVGMEEQVVKAVDIVEPSVVNVKTIWVSRYTGATQKGLGSGVIISPDGWIITNAHVTRNATKIFVTFYDGKTTLKALEWRADPSQDIAVIRVPSKNLPAAPIGSSKNLKKGQVAIAIGNPWRFASTVTIGCISATGRHLETSKIVLKDMIQTDAAINPGSSGGALVDSSGKVIGINTIVYTGSGDDYVQGLSFAIPIDHAISVARKLIKERGSGELKPWMGVTIQDVRPGMGFSVDRGAIITGFPPHSPARQSGFKVGDIIVSVNQVPIENTGDLKKVLSRYSPGDTINVILVRGEKKYRGKVKLEGMRQ